MRSLLLLFFLLIYCSAFSAPAHVKLDSCVGNFCLFKPFMDQKFVKRFGKGGVRVDEDDRLVHYRCFYIAGSKVWAEFEFDNHRSNSSELVSVFVSRSKLCSDAFVPRAPLSIDLEKGKIVIGMNEPDLVEKLGRPGRVEVLSDAPKNPIFNKRFGDRAYVYETANSVLYGVIYIRGIEVIGYRLSVEE